MCFVVLDAVTLSSCPPQLPRACGTAQAVFLYQLMDYCSAKQRPTVAKTITLRSVLTHYFYLIHMLGNS